LILSNIILISIIYLVIETVGIIILKTTLYERWKVRGIIRRYLKEEIDPIIKTNVQYPFISSSNIFGFSDYEVYCNFNLGDAETGAYIQVNEGFVNNKIHIRSILKSAFSKELIKQQRREKTLKGLIT